MDLDLVPLQRSIGSLAEALEVQAGLPEGCSEALKATVRAGVIQTFEVCYEQCCKFIQRWLALNPTPDIASQLRTRRDLFRHAAAAGLIDDAALWFAYGQARNATAHTYRLETANEVASKAQTFLEDARRLDEVLTRSNG